VKVFEQSDQVKISGLHVTLGKYNLARSLGVLLLR
jgi:hypothetical protein